MIAVKVLKFEYCDHETPYGELLSKSGRLDEKDVSSLAFLDRTRLRGSHFCKFE